MFSLLLLYLISAEDSDTDKIQLNVTFDGTRAILNWTGFHQTQNVYYTVYSSIDNGINWLPVSSFDYNTTQEVKVLNVYPVGSSGITIPRVTFYFKDGSTLTTERSASLKVWMEGGYYDYEGHFPFDAYGLNPYTKEQIIKVTPKTTAEFEKIMLDEMRNYDVIVFGTWDANGREYLSDEAVERVKEYINLGYGVLIGHDVIGSEFGNEVGLGRIADMFGIKLGTRQCQWLPKMF
ncbi:DUF5057 domain-containing protein [Histomonas meleagridis]|uniref:DUF5057 domain-containing protein n=1 Tax=Histomonas meleagridis TaxID=135588 RepID=UPI00355A0470|nr:DUF5057 domain-containing protein [Histomonas meleagridis]